METTMQKSGDINGHTAAKIIRDFASLEEAEAFISDDEKRTVVLGALEAKRKYANETGTPTVQYATLDKMVAGIHQLAEDGYSEPRDFNDRPESQTKVPDYLPKRDKQDRDLYYAWIGRDNIQTHEFTSGDNKFMVPVTRAIFPEIDVSNLSVEGFIQRYDLICCVGLDANAIAYRAMKNERVGQMVKSTAERTDKTGDGYLTQGINSTTAPSIKESMGRILKSI